MDLPADVRVYNEQIGLKGNRGTLIAVHAYAIYELKLQLKEHLHRAFVPVAETSLIFSEPEVSYIVEDEIER